MVQYTDPSDLEERLKAFFDAHGEDVFLFHTDLGACGPLKGVFKRTEYLTAYTEALFNAARGRTLLFPLFNYDYGKTRRFNVLEDKCQVGVLNEFIRLQRPDRRTRTPIFNFIEWTGETFSLSPSKNPFGEDSIWGELCRRNGRVCFLGAGFHSNTFIHYAEEMMDIGYRYVKPMAGDIVFGGWTESVSFNFRARPRVGGAVDYDWGRLEKDLTQKGLLGKHSLGEGRILSINACSLLDYWQSRLKQDELYLLTDASRVKIAELRKTKPYPFRFEDFEPEEK